MDIIGKCSKCGGSLTASHLDRCYNQLSNEIAVWETAGLEVWQYDTDYDYKTTTIMGWKLFKIEDYYDVWVDGNDVKYPSSGDRKWSPTINNDHFMILMSKITADGHIITIKYVDEYIITFNNCDTIYGHDKSLNVAVCMAACNLYKI